MARGLGDAEARENEETHTDVSGTRACVMVELGAHLTAAGTADTFRSHPAPTNMRRPNSHALRIVTLAGLIGVGACAGREPAKPMQRLQLRALPSPAGPRSAEPFVSTGPSSTVLLSWLERQPDSTTVVLKVATADSNERWSPPRAVVSATDLFVNWADFPSVVALADGRLLAHWLQKNGGGKYAYDVKLAQSGDGGQQWTPVGSPHTPGLAAEHGFVTLLPRADSSADIVFLHGTPAATGSAEGHGPPMSLAAAHWSRDAGLATGASILDPRTCDCCQTAAASTSRGPVVIYRDRSDTEIRDMSVIRSVNGTWSAPTPLHADGWQVNGCPVNGPAVSAIGDTLAAVWFTAARDTAKVQLAFSTDAGATFGTPIRIDGGMPSGRLDVEQLRNGDALVTWIERTGTNSTAIRARLVRRDGTPEPPLTIATLPGGRATGFPRMTRRGDDVVLAWTQPGPISTVHLAVLTIVPR